MYHGKPKWVNCLCCGQPMVGILDEGVRDTCLEMTPEGEDGRNPDFIKAREGCRDSVQRFYRHDRRPMTETRWRRWK